MAEVTIYTTRYCPYCVRAKSLLDGKKVKYEEVAVDGQPQLRQKMTKDSGQHTVPQIWINDRHIGGCDDLYALQRAGQLDQLLAN